nr:MAG TPA: hypothetical protein [Caudoviricetes sp.]
MHLTIELSLKPGSQHPKKPKPRGIVKPVNRANSL